MTVRGEGVYRLVNEGGAADLANYMRSRAVSRRVKDGRAVSARLLEGGEAAALMGDESIAEIYGAIGGTGIAAHDRIGFPSYPYEWPPEMLYQAGVETIGLARELLDEGLGLKDATPLNILYRGTQPVFVDALSVEKRVAGDSRWLGYAQFARNFILPLAVNRDLGIPLAQVFLPRRDGLEPEEVYGWLGPWRRWRGVYFGFVTMPRLLGERRQAEDPRLYEGRVDKDPEKAKFVLGAVLRGLEKSLEKVKPRGRGVSVWSEYMSGNNNYSGEQFEFKEAFVADALKAVRPGRALDVGCNNGHFSAMAARAGAEVVAIDYDPVVAGEVYRSARAAGLNIQPLVVDLTRPSPACGWDNGEFPSFLDRARGRFDLVLMLAVIHHMLVTERVPLDAIVDQAASLTSGALVVEYVGPADSMFRRLTRGRDHLHASLTEEVFEASLGRRFEVVSKAKAPGSERVLYLARKRH